MVPGNDVKVAIEGIFASTGRVKVGWLIAEESFSKRAAKILLNLSLVAGEALVRGGQLDIGAEKRENCTEIVVRAEGPRIVLGNELRAALTGECDESALTPRAAAAWMVRKLVVDAGGQIIDRKSTRLNSSH